MCSHLSSRVADFMRYLREEGWYAELYVEKDGKATIKCFDRNTDRIVVSYDVKVLP